MDPQTTISITEARKNIFKIVSDVEKTGAQYTLTEKGKPKAVILSADEFDSWLETIEVMEDWPNYQKDIDKVHKDIKSGKYLTYPTLEETMKLSGLFLAENKAKYAVPNQIRAKRHKTTKKNSK